MTAVASKPTAKVSIKPLSDHVLVFADEADDRTPGGILLPEQAKEKPQSGTVVVVGPGKLGDDGQLLPCQVKAGDKVLYGRWAGSEIEHSDVEYRMMRESDILAVIE